MTSEGLLAALQFLPPEESLLRQRITVAVHEGVAFLMRTMVDSGVYAGGVPRAFGPLPVGHPDYDAAFNRRAREVRIDYVQHALSALLEYRRMVLDDGGPRHDVVD